MHTTRSPYTPLMQYDRKLCSSSHCNMPLIITPIQSYTCRLLEPLNTCLIHEQTDCKHKYFTASQVRGYFLCRYTILHTQTKYTDINISWSPSNPETYVVFTVRTESVRPSILLSPFLVPRAQICVVSLYNSHYGGVRFGAEASKWLSCLSGSLPDQLY